MNTDTLIHIVQTRIQASDNNPTGKSLLYELASALERLKHYEEGEFRETESEGD